MLNEGKKMANLRIKFNKFWLYTFFTLGIIVSCKGTGEYQFIPPFAKFDITPFLVVTNSVESLAFESNENYNDNVFGLIAPATISRWSFNWQTQKPQGVSGNLVIIQLTNSAPSGDYINHNGRDVYTYLIQSPDSVFNDSRDDNVLLLNQVVTTGQKIDNFLAVYAIDPLSDFVLFAPDSSSAANLASATKAYYALRYWGFPKERVGLLNGSVQHYGKNGLNSFFTLTAPSNTTSGRSNTTRRLLTDNTILQITLGDIFHILRGGNSQIEEPSALPASGAFFLDGRPASAFNGTQSSTNSSSLHQTCTTQLGGSCRVNHEGTIKGSSNLDSTSLYNSTSLSFHSKATLRSLLNALPYSDGKVIINFHRDGVSGSINQFITQNVLGKPSRLYEAGFVQWGALGLRDPQALTQPAALWRTDLSNLTDNLTTNVTANVANFGFTTVRQFTRNTNGIRKRDKEYIRSSLRSQTTGGGGGGASGPSGGGGNACGG